MTTITTTEDLQQRSRSIRRRATDLILKIRRRRRELKALTLIFFLFAVLPGCGPDQVEEAIIESIETTGATRTDLDTKILSLEEIRPFTAADSARLLVANWLPSGWTIDRVPGKIRSNEESIARMESKGNHEAAAEWKAETDAMKATYAVWEGLQARGTEHVGTFYTVEYEVRLPVTGARQKVRDTVIVTDEKTVHW